MRAPVLVAVRRAAPSSRALAQLNLARSFRRFNWDVRKGPREIRAHAPSMSHARSFPPCRLPWTMWAREELYSR
jgi:hypothetical protein